MTGKHPRPVPERRKNIIGLAVMMIVCVGLTLVMLSGGHWLLGLWALSGVILCGVGILNNMPG